MLQNQVRIIAGVWRGRKIAFPTLADLRPSPDRVRETLFNWLAPTLEGSTCLDLFAGTGILGLESLSRGALKVVAVEKNMKAIEALQKNAALLHTSAIDILRADALTFLTTQKEKFDVVFLDPPFKENLIPTCLALLKKHNTLKTRALVYFEADAALEENHLPEGYQLSKQKKAGHVWYGLIHYGL